ncbi:MAG: Nif3-like dinuclear metal center hexameric protein [Atribacterota bacterium]
MKIKELLDTLNQIAPFFCQEEFDNSGVQFADLNEDISKILLCLDVTEEIIQEAIREQCNVILSHHPLFFNPVYRIIKQDNPVAYQLIFHHINLISMHTNFDLAENGLNDYVGHLLALNKVSAIKSSPEKIYKLAVYVPVEYKNTLQDALFRSGAGQIGNYSETSFSIAGKGSFKPMDGSTPFIGKTGKRELVKEIKIETIFYERNLNKIIETIHQIHPYEEPVYDIYQLRAKSTTGIGMVAKLKKAQTLESFCKKIKKKLGAPYLRIIQSNKKMIQTVALCTGSGGSLIKQCINKQVEVLITGDIDYHEALKAKEMGLNIIDAEHFYTEKLFVAAIRKQLSKHQIPEDILVDSQKMNSPFQIL